jgi:hypothetical protein
MFGDEEINSRLPITEFNLLTVRWERSAALAKAVFLIFCSEISCISFEFVTYDWYVKNENIMAANMVTDNIIITTSTIDDFSFGKP